MTQSNGTAASWPEVFKSDFSRVKPWIAKEWPTLDGEALAGTGGDYEQVVSVVTGATAHTQTLVRAKLEELHALATERPKIPHDRDALVELLERLEKKTTDLAAELRSSVLPTAREKVKDNLLVSLLVALGLGFILGVIFALGGSRRER